MENVSYRNTERDLHGVVNTHKREFQMLPGVIWDGEVTVLIFCVYALSISKIFCNK